MFDNCFQEQISIPQIKKNKKTHLTIKKIFIFIFKNRKLRLCLVPGKFEGKCEGKKIQRKSRRKEKVKENKKID